MAYLVNNLPQRRNLLLYITCYDQHLPTFAEEGLLQLNWYEEISIGVHVDKHARTIRNGRKRFAQTHSKEPDGHHFILNAMKVMDTVPPTFGGT
jgi:hypothetical protein